MSLKIRKRWIALSLVVILLLIGGFSLLSRVQDASQTEATGSMGEVEPTLITIQPGSIIMDEVSASGNIELVSQHQIALPVDGTVRDVAVSAGDVVTAGKTRRTDRGDATERAGPVNRSTRSG